MIHLMTAARIDIVNLCGHVTSHFTTSSFSNGVAGPVILMCWLQVPTALLYFTLCLFFFSIFQSHGSLYLTWLATLMLVIIFCLHISINQENCLQQLKTLFSYFLFQQVLLIRLSDISERSPHELVWVIFYTYSIRSQE